MKNKKYILSLILMGVIVAVFAVLYFVLHDIVYLKIGLLAVGVLNVVNGVIAIKSQLNSVGIIYLIGGAALTILMTVSFFI